MRGRRAGGAGPCGTRRVFLADLRDRRRDRDDEERDPECEEPTAPAGNGLPTVRERARSHAYAIAISAIGASCSGAIVQLVHSDGSSTPVTVRSPRGRRGTGRTRRRASRSQRPTRWSNVCVQPSSRQARLASEPLRAASARRGAALRRIDGLRRTKLILARQRGALRLCGADLAAHCINDVITCGADPLFFLDYVAANRIDLEAVADLVEGAAEVCRQAGVALVGGETAEPPSIARTSSTSRARVSGWSSARACSTDRASWRATPWSGSPRPECTRTGSRSCGASSKTRTTSATISSPRRASTSRTYGAFAVGRTPSPTSRAVDSRELDRALPDGLRAEIDWDAWERLPVFAWLARHVEEDELRRVFNLGIGYLAVMPVPGDDLVIGRIVRA